MTYFAALLLHLRFIRDGLLWQAGARPLDLHLHRDPIQLQVHQKSTRIKLYGRSLLRYREDDGCFHCPVEGCHYRHGHAANLKSHLWHLHEKQRAPVAAMPAASDDRPPARQTLARTHTKPARTRTKKRVVKLDQQHGIAAARIFMDEIGCLVSPVFESPVCTQCGHVLRGRVTHHLFKKHHVRCSQEDIDAAMALLRPLQPEEPPIDLGAESEPRTPIEGIPILDGVGCPLCQACFTTKGSLWNHIVAEHPDEPEAKQPPRRVKLQKPLRGVGARCVEVIVEESHDASAADVSENEEELEEQQRFKQFISSAQAMASEAEEKRCPHGVHQMHPFYDGVGMTLIINELKPERMVELGHNTPSALLESGMHELFWSAYEQLSDQGLAAAAVTRLFDDNEGQYQHRPMRQVQPQTVSRYLSLGTRLVQFLLLLEAMPAPDPSSFLGQVLASRGSAVIDATVALRAGLDAEMTKKELVEPLTSLWLALVEVELSLFDNDKVHFVNVFLLCTAMSKGSGILQDIRQWTTTPAGLLYVFKLFLLRRGKNESWSVANELRPYMQPGRLVHFLSQRTSMARTASMAEGQAGVNVDIRADGDVTDETLRTIVCRGIELNVEELGAALEQMRKDMTETLDKHLLLDSRLRKDYEKEYERLRLKEDRTNRVKNWWVGHGSPAENALFDHIGQTPSLRQEFIQTEHGPSGELTFRENRVRVWLPICLPPRASVYQGLSYKNGVGRQRSAFFAEKQLSILTRVSKTYWLSLNEQHTFRYMDQEISTLIFMYLLLCKPLEHMLSSWLQKRGRLNTPDDENGIHNAEQDDEDLLDDELDEDHMSHNETMTLRREVRDARNHYNNSHLLFNIAPLQTMVADGLDVLIVTTDMFVRVGSESLHGKVCFQRIRTVVAASVGSGRWTNIKRVALTGKLCIGDQEHLFRKLGQQVGGKVYRLETMRRDLQLRVLHGNQPNFLSHVQAIVDTQRNMRQANGERVHMMVFCDTVNEVKLLCDQLHARGYVALPYYTDLEEKAQKDHVAQWQRGECDVIVATSCLSTGVDLLTIRHVLWYGNGYNIYTLAQAFGRAGRDKQGGTAELWLPVRRGPAPGMETFVEGSACRSWALGKLLDPRAATCFAAGQPLCDVCAGTAQRLEPARAARQQRAAQALSVAHVEAEPEAMAEEEDVLSEPPAARLEEEESIGPESALDVASASNVETAASSGPAAVAAQSSRSTPRAQDTAVVATNAGPMTDAAVPRIQTSDAWIDEADTASMSVPASPMVSDADDEAPLQQDARGPAQATMAEDESTPQPVMQSAAQPTPTKHAPTPSASIICVPVPSASGSTSSLARSAASSASGTLRRNRVPLVAESSCTPGSGHHDDDGNGIATSPAPSTSKRTASDVTCTAAASSTAVQAAESPLPAAKRAASSGTRTATVAATATTRSEATVSAAAPPNRHNVAPIFRSKSGTEKKYLMHHAAAEKFISVLKLMDDYCMRCTIRQAKPVLKAGHRCVCNRVCERCHFGGHETSDCSVHLAYPDRACCYACGMPRKIRGWDTWDHRCRQSQGLNSGLSCILLYSDCHQGLRDLAQRMGYNLKEMTLKDFDTRDLFVKWLYSSGPCPFPGRGHWRLVEFVFESARILLPNEAKAQVGPDSFR
ncbi:uncharacterized protein MONBRDRAFT_9531 [Monosiga brevicollis MX1]|uniref:Helicase C-terminal domain-containing protein n=1 Tax=Monosiga brevicollis TaxID=81824 RepID=A9V3F8_MONBE|nr:uncharacterized protein MONBRDRAFT_9531 [Monosiga brevicollis MX1]EDQ88054.1 predicted protein [Monosiga brevicollis MX1]|eukprot:XP_001747130.1 hypothetical protein [Monosiga brevicollis MX1]